MTVRTHPKLSPLVVSPPRYDSLTVTLGMLPSVNSKHGSRPGPGRKFFTNRSYRRKEQSAVDDLETQLLVENSRRREHGRSLWVPRTTDRYIILYDFDFEATLRQDLHNPLKPTCDLLKKAGLIFEDNRVFQEFLEKFPKMPYPMARITIYRMSEKDYCPVPTHALVETWLESHYQLAV